MPKTQLDRRATGIADVSPLMVRRRGFGLDSPGREPPDLDDPRLVLDCPFCGRATPCPRLAGDGSATMAECDRCDLYFTFAPDEVYTTPTEGPTTGDVD